jgi:hypothetical protein
MGYDMYIEQPLTDDEAKARDAARAHLESLTRPYDLPEGAEREAAQKLWDEAWRAFGDTEVNYFRLNIWGMGRYRVAMHALGMVVENQHPPFPQLPDGITWDDVEVVEYPEEHEGETPKPEAVAHHQAMEAVLAWHSDEPKGIEVHKFGTNDNWNVTPEEIAAALDAYHDKTPEQVAAVLAECGITERDYWDRWIAWLTRAQGMGGFRVR